MATRAGHLFNDRGERLFFNEEERSAFIRAADGAADAVRTFCNVLHYTGCNFTEALDLAPRSVDCDAGAIVFHGYGAARTVPVPDSLLDLLDTAHGVRYAPSGPEADQRLWPCTRMTMFKKVVPVIAGAGITGGPHATPRGIRHGFFVHAVRRRVLLTRLQRWMGHSGIDYTEQRVADLMRHAPELLGDERADAERLW